MLSNSMGCSIFCCLPVPVAATITSEMNDTVYGWRVIGFDTLTLWLPDMERCMRAAKLAFPQMEACQIKKLSTESKDSK
jgi:hypothetical protein